RSPSSKRIWLLLRSLNPPAFSGRVGRTLDKYFTRSQLWKTTIIGLDSRNSWGVGDEGIVLGQPRNGWRDCTGDCDRFHRGSPATRLAISAVWQQCDICDRS